MIQFVPWFWPDWKKRTYWFATYKDLYPLWSEYENKWLPLHHNSNYRKMKKSLAFIALIPVILLLQSCPFLPLNQVWTSLDCTSQATRSRVLNDHIMEQLIINMWATSNWGGGELQIWIELIHKRNREYMRKQFIFSTPKLTRYFSQRFFSNSLPLPLFLRKHQCLSRFQEVEVNCFTSTSLPLPVDRCAQRSVKMLVYSRLNGVLHYFTPRKTSFYTA